jgi:hypothetical protein
MFLFLFFVTLFSFFCFFLFVPAFLFVGMRSSFILVKLPIFGMFYM